MSEPEWAVLAGSTSRTSNGLGPAPVRTRWDPGLSPPSLAGRPAARRHPATLPIPPPGSLAAGRSFPAPSRPVRGHARPMPVANPSRNGPPARADAARETAPRTAPIVRRTSSSSARPRSRPPARADAAHGTAPRRDRTPHRTRDFSTKALPRHRDGGLRFVPTRRRPARCGNPCSPAASDSPSGAPSSARSAPAVWSSHPSEGSSPRSCVPDPFLAPRSPAGKRSAGRTSRIGSSGGRSSMLFRPKSSRNLRVTP